MSEEKVLNLLPEIVRRLQEELHPERIYLFGSYAYGTPRRHSDLDLLVVVPDSPLSFFGALSWPIGPWTGLERPST